MGIRTGSGVRVIRRSTGGGVPQSVAVPIVPRSESYDGTLLRSSAPYPVVNTRQEITRAITWYPFKILIDDLQRCVDYNLQTFGQDQLDEGRTYFGDAIPLEFGGVVRSVFPMLLMYNREIPLLSLTANEPDSTTLLDDDFAYINYLEYEKKRVGIVTITPELLDPFEDLLRQLRRTKGKLLLRTR